MGEESLNMHIRAFQKGKVTTRRHKIQVAKKLGGLKLPTFYKGLSHDVFVMCMNSLMATRWVRHFAPE